MNINVDYERSLRREDSAQKLKDLINLRMLDDHAQEN
jgi:hypothetical protein